MIIVLREFGRGFVRSYIVDFGRVFVLMWIGFGRLVFLVFIF